MAPHAQLRVPRLQLTALRATGAKARVARWEGAAHDASPRSASLASGARLVQTLAVACACSSDDGMPLRSSTRSWQGTTTSEGKAR